MNKNILLVILIIVVFIIGMLIGKYAFSVDSTVTGNVVSDNVYSWTTAICDDENRCIDVLIECENGNVKNMKPVGNVNEYSDNWTDRRVVGVRYCE